MRATVLSLLAAATLATAQSTDAPVVTINPIGAKYIATLPSKEGSTLKGSLVATTNDKGVVHLNVEISGLPKEGGPFMYHIHAKPVPADGNCTGTGAHLDPYKRGEVPLCDATKQESCQTGDLSGKHSNITGQEINIGYDDHYLALNPADPSFFGNLSFVVHLSNKTRIGCANFEKQNEGSYTTTVSATASSSVSGVPTGGQNGTATATVTETRGPTGTPIRVSTTVPPEPSNTSGAQKLVAGAGVLVAGVAAMIL